MRKNRSFVLTLVCVMLTVVGYCQGGGGGMGGGMGGQGGGMGMEGMSSSKSTKSASKDLVLSTGLFAIDYDTVIEECKVKEKDTETRKILKKNIDDYNSNFFKASEELHEEVSFVTTIQYMISGGMDIGSVNKEMQKIRSYSNKIEKRMQFEHKKLNLAMTNSLSKKMAKKWSKYHEELCEENSFSTTENTRPQGGGQGSGMSGPPQGGGGGGMRM